VPSPPRYQLSDHAAKRIQARKINEQWIIDALESPDREEPDQVDPNAMHALKKISEMDDRVLRVVYNPSVHPVRVISVHFDRRLRGKL
jgi:hypothetical protein